MTTKRFRGKFAEAEGSAVSGISDCVSPAFSCSFTVTNTSQCSFSVEVWRDDRAKARISALQGHPTCCGGSSFYEKQAKKDGYDERLEYGID